MMRLCVVSALLFTVATARADDGAQVVGYAMHPDVLVPMNDGFGSRQTAFGGSVAYWSQPIPEVAIEARLGLQYGPGEQGSRYWNVPGDVGAFYLPFASYDVTPLVGGGFGLRYLNSRGPESEEEVGAVMVTTVTRADTYSAFGFGWYLRAGVMFFRTSRVRMTVTADYSYAFLSEGNRPQAVTMSVGLVL